MFGIYKEEFSTSLNDPVFEWDKDGGGDLDDVEFEICLDDYNYGYSSPEMEVDCGEP